MIFLTKLRVILLSMLMIVLVTPDVIGLLICDNSLSKLHFQSEPQDITLVYKSASYLQCSEDLFHLIIKITRVSMM